MKRVLWRSIPVFLFLLTHTLCAQAAGKPNILFFLVDDMGTQDTSVPFLYDREGQPVISKLNQLYRTPNMEKLAENARLFTQARAYSVCSPTRISLITGINAPRHKVTQWTHPKTWKSEPGSIQTKTLRNPEWKVSGLPAGLPTLPGLLKQAGYATLFAGKAHFGPDDTVNGDPVNVGFEINIAGFGGGGPGSYWGKYNFSANHRTGAHVWDVPGLQKYHGSDTFLTEAIALEMNAVIEKAVDEGRPFFAYMSHYAVHAPFLYPDARFTKNYPQLKGHALAFATLIEGMDKSLGDMIRKLDELGVAEETLIIFYSDNGSANPLGSKPLRGIKGTRHEGGTRVPLMVAWAKPDPEHRFQKRLPVEAGTREDAIVTCTDFMPTILRIAGVKHPSPEKLDGFDISPYFSGQDAQRPQEFLVHFPHAHRNNLFSSLILGDWKVIYSYESRSWELYNLKEDPWEAENRAKERPEILEQMAESLIARLDENEASYPVSVQTGEPVKPVR